MYDELVYNAVSRSQDESKISCRISMKHTGNQEWAVQQEVSDTESYFLGATSGCLTEDNILIWMLRAGDEFKVKDTPRRLFAQVL